jgi:hypothetical protein
VKRLLFIHPGPFGYHTPTYYYCLLLRNKYNITYIGIDEKLENKNIEGIRYIHLSTTRNSLLKRFSYFNAIRKELKENKYDFILVNYFVFCSALRLLTKSSMVVEVRTSFIFTNIIKRFIYNLILITESRLFKNVTTISTDLAKFLLLPRKTYIIPLGAPSFPSYKKDFDSFRVLYVGTFYGREIPNTIHAFARFAAEFGKEIVSSYTIIGFGSIEEMERIRKTIKELAMDNFISYKGVIRYPELIKYFEINNIGMSYIPLKRRYNSQPPIKSFEYLLSGMAVLATETKENKKVINSDNGVLIGDSIDDIYDGLKKIYFLRNSFQSERIQKESQKYSWNSIVDNSFIPYIESF